MLHNRENNMRTLSIKILKANKNRNLFIIITICLTALMISSILSIGMSFYESISMREMRMQGSVSHMAFNQPTQQQLDTLQTLEYVESIGIGAYVADIIDADDLKNIPIAYVSETQWNEMFMPAYSNVIGDYPRDENEIALSRYILEKMGIDNPQIGMEIFISYISNDNEKTYTEKFILSTIYTEYAHGMHNNFVAIFCSKMFAEKHNALNLEKLTVNIIFKNSKNVNSQLEILKNDLSFTKEQQYAISPAFDENYEDNTTSNGTTYTTVFSLILLLMFTGYLCIYNVMYLSIAKDIQFWGLLKTLGTTKKQLKKIVQCQALLLCIISIPLGCLLSAIASFYIVPLFIKNSGIDVNVVVSFSPVIYVATAFFVLVTVFAATISPAKKAMSISPVEAVTFTGLSSSNKSKYRTTSDGKLYIMAIRNIFRDRKRVFIVVLSLFFSITIFTVVTTAVNSIDINDYIDAEYTYDFILGSTDKNKIYLSDEFVSSVSMLDGIEDMSIISLGTTTNLCYSENLNKYLDWYCKQKHMSSEQVINNGVFNTEYGIRGVDSLTIKELNKTLDTPIDIDAFERGETVLIYLDTYDQLPYNPDNELFDILGDVASIRLFPNEGGEAVEMSVSCVVGKPITNLYYGRGYSYFEIVIANNHLSKYASDIATYYIDINAKDGRDEQLHYGIESISKGNNIQIVSKYIGRQAMRDTKITMRIFGVGLSVILGVIGIINFINVMSVNIISRRLELAILESIGMRKKQVKTMLKLEGAGYSILAIVSALILGNGIALGFYILIKMAVPYAMLNFPVFLVALIYMIIFLICYISPNIIYNKFNKNSLVERIRDIS